MDRNAALELLTADPARTGIFCDFDGTLSGIVDRPEDAGPVPGAAEALTDLARAFAVGAVISGRSLDDLRSRFAPDGVVLAGSYGRERSDSDGQLRTDAREWERIVAAAAEAAGDWDGVFVERKGAGVALHYRKAPDRADDVRKTCEALARSFDLEVRPGRLVVELVAPGPGKAEALRAFVEERGLEAFLFAGDDMADAEAFGWARGSGISCVLVGVRSEESPAEIEALADLTVGSPEEVVAFFDDLRRRVRRPG